MLFISIYRFCSNDTSFIKFIFLLISKIVIISHQKRGSNLLHTMSAKEGAGPNFRVFPDAR